MARPPPSGVINVMEVEIKESASKEEAAKKVIQRIPMPLAETYHGYRAWFRPRVHSVCERLRYVWGYPVVALYLGSILRRPC